MLAQIAPGELWPELVDPPRAVIAECWSASPNAVMVTTAVIEAAARVEVAAANEDLATGLERGNASPRHSPRYPKLPPAIAHSEAIGSRSPSTAKPTPSQLCSYRSPFE
jgi:hypothetical protein